MTADEASRTSARRDAQIDDLRERAASCRACDLWQRATQTVFGAGNASTADVMLVGEQPGDQEDIAGEPFVGPAGQLLDRALAEAGIDRRRVYVTNAVKHFKWRPQGKRRLHEKPNATEVRACLPWLQAELALVRPRVLVLLGATAAQAALGSPTRIGESPGNVVLSPLAPHVLVTLHPSAVLRSETPDSREARYRRLVEDFRWVADHAAAGPTDGPTATALR
jgi:uracil-DNA glycosylase family protein